MRRRRKATESRPGRSRKGVEGAHLNPLAERTCFSQVKTQFNGDIDISLPRQLAAFAVSNIPVYTLYTVRAALTYQLILSGVPPPKSKVVSLVNEHIVNCNKHKAYTESF